MDVRIKPSQLQGTIVAPPSKSMAHRALICAALSDGESLISNVALSEDISATINTLTALGAKFSVEGSQVTVSGIKTPNSSATIDCTESGSTLRFLIPIAAAFGVDAKFTGKGSLFPRKITLYISEFSAKGVDISAETIPFDMSGKLQAGTYTIDGDISSQFISGLLFALPLINGDSEIKINGKLQSKPYADMTIGALADFGINVTETENGYHIKGNQKYTSADYTVEGDCSQIAFYAVAGAIGSTITCKGINLNTKQGDRQIIDIIRDCGAKIEVLGDMIAVSPMELSAFSVDVCDIPDLVPILAVLATFCDGKSTLYNAKRLRIKESDRLNSTATLINSLGGNVAEYDDYIEITGVESLKGGETDSFNDHRIAMSAAILALRCEGDVVLSKAESINKSYPSFYEDYNKIGGSANVINME